MMNGKIIINIQDDDISQLDALEYIKAVMSLGRVSGDGESYCYCSKFTDGTVVLADKKKSDIFYIRKDKTNDM